MEKLKVIIADDMKILVEMNKKIVEQFEELEIIGFAYNGQEELNLIEQYNPDLVITDNQMPIINGVDIIQKISNSDMKNKPTFILVTGDSGMVFTNNAYKAGAFKVVNKNNSESQLKYAIDEYLCLQNTNESVIINEHENFSNTIDSKEESKRSIFSKLFKREKR